MNTFKTNNNRFAFVFDNFYFGSIKTIVTPYIYYDYFEDGTHCLGFSFLIFDFQLWYGNLEEL